MGHLGGLVQDVAESTALTIGESLDLGGADVAVGFEELVEFFLGNFLSKVTNQQVGVSIELLITLLKADAEELAIQFKIVHGISSLLGFFLNSERHETVVKRLLGEVVDTDCGTNGAVTLGLEELLQLKVEEVRRQVSDVNCWWALFLLLGSIATAVLLINNALQHLLHSSVSLGTSTHHLLRRALALHLVGIGTSVHLLVHVLLRREVAHG